MNEKFNQLISATIDQMHGIEPYKVIIPDGWVPSYVIDPEYAEVDGKGEYGACPICEKSCPEHEEGKSWLHVVNRINDAKHPRRYHFRCLLKETPMAEAVAKVEGAPTNVGDGISVVVHFLPLDGKDNAELAAAMMTENRQAQHDDMTETSGAWYRMAGKGGYVSPMLRNLKWQKRLETMAKLCDAATVIVKIYLDGVYAERVKFDWSNRDERGRWISSDKRFKSGFLVKLDWEVGKYRSQWRKVNGKRVLVHGLQQYNYKENVERAKLERDFSNPKRKRFWL